MHVLVSQTGNGEFVVSEFDSSVLRSPELPESPKLSPTDAQPGPARRFSLKDFLSFVVEREAEHPRWVWADTGRAYPVLLRAGIRVSRCHDLRLCHTILRRSELTMDAKIATAATGAWDREATFQAPVAAVGITLFDLAAADDDDAQEGGIDEIRRELVRQLAAVESCSEPARLRLLLAAESVGALIGAEMQFAGLPWRTAVHDALLRRELGNRPAEGVRPEKLERLAEQIRLILGDDTLNPDSPPDLLRALRRAGLAVTTTRAWELQELRHPVIDVLLRYKKLARLLSANGWVWMDTWIINGRFHPEYVPGGVVTGRWATRGGGALQLPKQVRAAVTADEGWKLVVADASQLEPRILAALSQDSLMAAAGKGTDLYAGIVASGVVETRDQAKVAMLGAMYGATSGESGRLLPKLVRAYPRALALTETAARIGERGGIVSTRLGRSSPPPPDSWQELQDNASEQGSSETDERRARSQSRDWGRFTRNFIVQGTAAEWALCWMGEVRRELMGLAARNTPSVQTVDLKEEATGRSSPFAGAPHLVFFLHDEIIVHAPAALADEVQQIVIEAAHRAGRLLFGNFPVDFLLTSVVVESYADAK